MYASYYSDYEVRPEFAKAYISIWDGWLGPANSHKLASVTESEWSRFNALLALIVEQHEVHIADHSQHVTSIASSQDDVVQSYHQAMNKDASKFLRLVLPHLECVLEESWDYTYVLWYKQSRFPDVLLPLIAEVGLFCFRDSRKA